MNKKQPEHFEIPDNIVKNVLIGVCGFAVIAGLAFITPWAELQASSIASDQSAEQQVVEQMKKMNLALAAIQQKETTIENVHEYLLVKDIVGTDEFTIEENTCAHGARVIVRLRDNFRESRTSQTGEINIQGISAAKGRSIYSASVLVDDAMPAKMRNLPSQMILDEDTVFPAYQISPGKNAERVEYKIECY